MCISTPRKVTYVSLEGGRGLSRILLRFRNEPGGGWPGGHLVLRVRTARPYTPSWLSQAESVGTLRHSSSTDLRCCCTGRGSTKGSVLLCNSQRADFSFVRTPIPEFRVGVRRRERQRAKCQPYSSWSAKAGSQSRRSREPSVSPALPRDAAYARVCTPLPRRSRTRHFARSHVSACRPELRSPRTSPVRVTTSRNTRSFSSAVDV